MNDVAWQGSIVGVRAGDPLSLLAYADWLDERGKAPDKAFVLRWMAKHGRRPGHRQHYKPGTRLVPVSVSWCWLKNGTTTYDKALLSDRTSELPNPVFVAIGGSLARGHVYYDSWLSAIEHLAYGLSLIRQIMEV